MIRMTSKCKNVLYPILLIFEIIMFLHVELKFFPCSETIVLALLVRFLSNTIPSGFAKERYVECANVGGRLEVQVASI